jgi:chaperonin cofactor prefoldin
MASIERTAYPRFKQDLNRTELEQLYSDRGTGTPTGYRQQKRGDGRCRHLSVSRDKAATLYLRCDSATLVIRAHSNGASHADGAETWYRKNCEKEGDTMNGVFNPHSRIYMINDAPSAKDQLNFERYVAPLVQIIADRKSQTPFTIGIFGAWGSGKSTLLQHVNEKLEQKRNDLEFFRIEFNPWIYREEKNMVVPLLHTIHDMLEQAPGNRFVESAKKIGTILTRVGADLLLKAVTAKQVSLENLEKHEKAYLEQHKRAKSAMRQLKKELQEVIDEITGKGEKGRVVFFIDDLDRCEPDQIVGLLEAIKLFLELQYCFFVLAVDEEVVHRGIQMKYANFEFLKERKDQIGREYLEKMIQLPLYLYPLSENQVADYLKDLALPEAVKQHTNLLAEIMQPNPRKIKRILNLLLLNLAVVQRDNALKEQIRADVLARLIVIQVQDYDLYRDILQNIELLEYLIKVYQEEIQVDHEPDFAKLGDRRDLIRNLCKRYYRPESWLESLFTPEEAFPPATQLAIYFNMLGRGEST